MKKLLGLTAAIAVSVFAFTANAAKLELTEHDIVVGNKDAKVLIVEYASMTCGHCASFHKDVYKHIKKDFIDKGEVAFVYRHMPWGNLALAVSKITDCAGEKNREKFISAYFNTQQQWTRAADPLASITQIARLGGMDAEQVDKCLMNSDIHESIITTKETGISKLSIESTPTVYINDKKIVGTQSYDVYKKVIEEKLK